MRMMNRVKYLMFCFFLLLNSMEAVLAQEKLNEFVITRDENCPFTIRPGDGEYGFVVINTGLSDLHFTIPSAPRRLESSVFYTAKQQWILKLVPNDNNYKRYRITINSDGFKQGELEVSVKQKESICFDVNPLYESNKTNLLWYVVPGLGQIEMGKKAEGFVTMGGEALLLGGGLISNLIANKQYNIMQDSDVSLGDYVKAKSRYNTQQKINIACYLGAAALYGIHIYRVYHLSKKTYNKKLALLTPAIVSTDQIAALGLSLNFNF